MAVSAHPKCGQHRTRPSSRVLLTFRISFSFYAGVMGSWVSFLARVCTSTYNIFHVGTCLQVLFGVPSYSYTAGYMGLIFYAVSSGFPILVMQKPLFALNFCSVSVAEILPNISY